VPFVRDPDHWLLRFSPREWIDAALGELRRAEEAYQAMNARGGVAGARRAAGMALNAALVVDPDEGWGRTYMEHLQAIARDASLPLAVTSAAKILVEAPMPGSSIVGLRSRSGDERILEAARTVMAHAYARVVHYEPEEPS
jgi:HEPN domain-containing protein